MATITTKSSRSASHRVRREKKKNDASLIFSIFESVQRLMNDSISLTHALLLSKKIYDPTRCFRFRTKAPDPPLHLKRFPDARRAS